ncbi:unnamed protein product [Diatraea saccharalis]|uniref:Regulatory protein zeste n=1 Tax=Diatraea saccharalis TaxID=40085 RepID=A0A9P0CAF2_9NEOP|nr:unnamed protein product [Diatraea saccharalis]
MSAVLTRCRVSPEQLDILLNFMEDHPDFAAGKQSLFSRFSTSKLWRLLAERLNAAAADSGGARKSPDKWCRYWADIKYKARRKFAAGGALGELSSAEERLQNILRNSGRDSSGRGAASDEERKPTADDDMCSEGSGAGGAGGVGGAGAGAGLAPEDLLAEAAMRTALAAEKQAEAVAQAVDLLRDLVQVCMYVFYAEASCRFVIDWNDNRNCSLVKLSSQQVRGRALRFIKVFYEKTFRKNPKSKRVSVI